MSQAPRYSRRRKVLISLFLLFHFFCVGAFVFPSGGPVTRFLLTRSVPWPSREDGRWTAAPQPVIPGYLRFTSQGQNWLLFAPDPFRFNRYLTAEVVSRGGRTTPYRFPQVQDAGFVAANLRSRYRDYQFYAGQRVEILSDFGRWLARRSNDPADPPAYVRVYTHEMDIPPPGSAPAAPSALIRDESRYFKSLVLVYEVRPEDLR